MQNSKFKIDCYNTYNTYIQQKKDYPMGSPYNKRDFQMLEIF